MSRPNVLFVMVDQLRADWLGHADHVPVMTPNIDRLAKRGVRFTNAICNSPLCAPSRASMATGRYPFRAGVLNNNMNLDPAIPNQYQVFRDAGYRVAAVGKTDLHKPYHYYGPDGRSPLFHRYGFTDGMETEGKINAARFTPYEFDTEVADGSYLAGPYQRFLKENSTLKTLAEDYQRRDLELPRWYAVDNPLPEDQYHDAFIGRHACETLRALPEDTPWYLFVSFVGPHDPWDAPPSYRARYADTTFPTAQPAMNTGKPEWVKRRIAAHSAGYDADKGQKVFQHYAGMITHIDDWIGRLFEVLRNRGQEDNTIIVFASDHGEMLGDHGLFLKKVMYDAALRVPLIIHDPREQSDGLSSGAPVELVDLAPTLFELAGIAFPTTELDGRSLRPLLSDPSLPHKQTQFSELDGTRAVVRGSMKYIQNLNDKPELYDRSVDPWEKDNRASASPDMVRALQKELNRLHARV